MASDRGSSRRRFVKSVGLVGTAGLTTIAGCSGGSSETTANNSPTDGDGTGNPNTTTANSGEWPNLSGKSVHLVTEQSSDPHQKLYNEIASAFEKATGATVNNEFVGLGTSGTKRVSQLIQAGSPPEISSTGMVNTATFQNNGILEPVTDVVEDIASALQMPKDNLRTVISGDDYQVPGWAFHVSFYYRDDIGDVKPDTWEKMLEYARQADGKNGLRGTYIPSASYPYQSYANMAWLFTNGGNMMKWEGDKIEVAYNSGDDRKKLIEVLKQRKQLHQYSPVASEPSYGAWLSAVPNGVSASGAYAGLRPVLSAWRNESPFAKHVKPLPGGGFPKAKGGSQTSTGGVVGYSVFKGSNVNAAKTYLEFAYKNFYQDLSLALNPGHYKPVWPGLDQDKYFQGLKSTYRDRGWEISLDTVREYQNADIIPRPRDTNPPNPYAGVSYQGKPFLNLASEVLLKDTPPGEAIDKYAPRHQKTIDETQNK